MRIYIDIDDVVTETARALCSVAGEMFGRSIAYEDVFAFDLGKSFSLDRGQLARLMERAHSPDALASYQETPGASETILRWAADGHSMTFVTGRPASTHEGTRRWLDARGLGAIPVIHVDKFGRELDSMFHSPDYVVTLDDFLAMRFDFAVEDSPIGLGHLARIPGCRVAAFSRPWNAATPMPSPLFRRCDSWGQVDAYLRESGAGGGAGAHPNLAQSGERGQTPRRGLD